MVCEGSCEAEANALALALELAQPRAEVVEVNDGGTVGAAEALTEPDVAGQDVALGVEDEMLALDSAEALGKEEKNPECEVNSEDEGLLDSSLLLVGLPVELLEAEAQAVAVNAAVALTKVVEDGVVKGERESIVLGDACIVVL